MSQYNGNDIALLADLNPTNLQLLLERPVASWDTGDWHYAVLVADESFAVQVQIMDLLRAAYPQLGDEFIHVLQVWEAGYGPKWCPPSEVCSPSSGKS